jgi:hypothetical protein
MNCPHKIDVAAYVLDALEPRETERMREHFPDCPECRPDYEELCTLPPLLWTLTPADVEGIVSPTELPQELREALIARAAGRRRRLTRVRPLRIAAAAAALVVGVATGAVVTGQPSPAPGSATVSATDPQTHVHTSLTLTSRGWGTQIRLHLAGVAGDQHCVLLVRAADGRLDTAATWVASYQGTADVTGATSIQVGQIRHLDITTTAGRRLVSPSMAGVSH